MQFVSFDKNDIINGRGENIVIDDMDRFLALYNCNVYWVIPKVCSKCANIPEHTQYLLWKKNNGGYGIMLPLADGDIKAALQGGENGVCVTFNGAVSGSEPNTAELLYIGSGDGPYDLSYKAILEISKRLGSFKMRNKKKIPKFLDYIGWCTWDAFYGSVDKEKVIMGAEKYFDSNVILGILLGKRKNLRTTVPLVRTIIPVLCILYKAQCRYST